MSMNEIRISKSKLYFTFFLILILAVVLVYFYVYQPNQVRKEEIEEYKKSVYESIFCQYSCPIVEVDVLNQTNLLPDVSCTKVCTENLKAKNISLTHFSEEDVLDDNLFIDIDAVIRNCKQNNYNSETEELNYTSFFSCSAKEIESLKESYSYLS